MHYRKMLNYLLRSIINANKAEKIYVYCEDVFEGKNSRMLKRWATSMAGLNVTVHILVYVSTAKNLPMPPNADKHLDVIKKLHDGLDNIWLQVNVVRRTIPRNPSKVHVNPNFEREARFANSPPSNCQVAQLVANTYNMYLSVRNNRVKAFNKDKLLPDEGIFEIQSYGTSIIRIFDIKSQKYLSMTDRGDVKAVSEKTDETLFKTTLEENNYHQIASHKYFIKQPHDYFISINLNGGVLYFSHGLPKAGAYSIQFMYSYKDLENHSCRKRR